MRPLGWRGRLHAFIEERRRAEFEFGVQDCGLWAADAVRAMTGVDHAAPFRGRYATMKGALRVLKKAGYDDHVDYFARNFPEIPPCRAGVGDLAVIDGEDGEAMGIVGGPTIFVAMQSGLGVVPLTEAKRAFRVE